MLDYSIDCKQEDCPYYGHYAGNGDDEFYINLGLSEHMIKSDIHYSNSFKNEVDLKIRATCNMCIFLPQERMDMKEYVLRQNAKRLLKR